MPSIGFAAQNKRFLTGVISPGTKFPDGFKLTKTPGAPDRLVINLMVPEKRNINGEIKNLEVYKEVICHGAKATEYLPLLKTDIKIKVFVSCKKKFVKTGGVHKTLFQYVVEELEIIEPTE